MKFRYLIWVLLVIWTVGVYADEPPTYTVKQIQQYQGVNEGDRVKVTGIVVVESARYGYSVTVICDPGGGPWAGIAVYDRDQRLVAERGDTVSVVGIVQEYYDKTEINCSDETEFPPQVTGHGATVPDPIEVTTGSADQEQYESCLIMLRNVEVLSNPDQYGNIAIDDGSGEFTLLLRKIDPAPSIGYVYDCLIGDDDYHFGEFKIRPRDENDWVCPGGPPTPTPPPDATPTPTPSGGTCDPSIELFFEGHQSSVCFQAGDTFHARFHILNPCMEDKSMDLYIILEVAGMYFFFPEWTQEISSSLVSVRADGEILDDILPPFEWPSGVGAYSGLFFYGIMAEPDTYNIMGDVAVLEFCYQ